MGDRLHDRQPLAWQATLGGMLAYGVRVAQCCTRCRARTWIPVDVAALVEAEGPQATLWDRRPECPACGERGHYMASPGEATPFTPLLSGLRHDEARRQFLKSFGFTRRDIARIKALAEAVTVNHSPAALADLDVPVRVGACMPGSERYLSGEVLGEWAGRVLVYWRMHPAEVERWARARRTGPKPVPSRR